MMRQFSLRFLTFIIFHHWRFNVREGEQRLRILGGRDRLRQLGQDRRTTTTLHTGRATQ
uniref:Uncharacterized protein n=1 Tax=Anopheles dirus TaxID=7168 RepID=A0A182NX58_9DIPT